jgi:hypothetical protein
MVGTAAALDGVPDGQVVQVGQLGLGVGDLGGGEVRHSQRAEGDQVVDGEVRIWPFSVGLAWPGAFEDLHCGQRALR